MLEHPQVAALGWPEFGDPRDLFAQYRDDPLALKEAGRERARTLGFGPWKASYVAKQYAPFGQIRTEHRIAAADGSRFLAIGIVSPTSDAERYQPLRCPGFPLVVFVDWFVDPHCPEGWAAPRVAPKKPGGAPRVQGLQTTIAELTDVTYRVHIEQRLARLRRS
jgi:hypothetical protein